MSSELKKASVGPAFIGGIFVFLLFALLVAVWFRFAGRTENYDDKRAADRMAKLSVLQKENHEKLTIYGWVNRNEGIVQIPIDDAMSLVVAELKAKPVEASAVKVENPYPAGLQQAPPTAAAAPAAAPTVSATPSSTPTAAPAPSAAASPESTPAEAPPAQATITPAP